MQTIARSDGASWRHVLPKTRAMATGDIPMKTAEATAARKTEVPGVAAMFKSAIASSGAGARTTGGIFRTA